MVRSSAPIVADIAAGVFLTVGMLAVGIPHGAVDHRVLNRSRLNRAFLAGYLGLMAAMGVVWFFSPALALGIFLLTSAWHFGQTDFEAWGISSPTVSALWGAALLLAITGSHTQETLSIVRELGIDLPAAYAQWGWTLAQISIVFSFALAVAHRSVQWLSTLMLLVVSVVAPLFVTFGVYFVGQHSLTAWSHLSERLPKNKTSLWAEALPFTIAAMLMFASSIVFVEVEPSLLLSAFIIFGSCVTFPHVLCMHRFYGSATSAIDKDRLEHSA